VLENLPLFSGLAAEDVRTLESHSHRKTYRKNTIVMEKGDETSSLYVLLSGRVKVFLNNEEGKEIVLNTLEPGDYFGELGLLGDTERSASVITQEDSKFLAISKREFTECLSANPQIMLSLMRKLVSQVQELTERVSSLALQDVYGRVARTLMQQAKEEDGRLATGKLTQQEIAQTVGASREMISRIFKDLREGGYISIEDKRIIINQKLPARW